MHAQVHPGAPPPPTDPRDPRDLWLEVLPQNVPGVPPARYPSWRRRMARSIAEIERDPRLRALLERVQSTRTETVERARC